MQEALVLIQISVKFSSITIAAPRGKPQDSVAYRGTTPAIDGSLEVPRRRIAGVSWAAMRLLRVSRSPKTILCIKQTKSGIATSRSSGAVDLHQKLGGQKCWLRRILGTIIKLPTLKEDDWLRLSSEKLGIQPHPSMFRCLATC